MDEFHFLRPGWLLTLPPLLLLAFRWLRQHPERNPWQAVVDAHLLAQLALPGAGRASRLPAVLLASAWLLAAIALAGPTWSRYPATQYRPDAPPLVIVLDLSRSMDAVDLRPSRLEVARAKLRRLLERLPPRTLGLVAYAAQGHAVLPLTEDAAIIAEWVEALETGLMPVQGSNATAGLARARELLQRNGEPQGHVLLVTDGADTAATAQARRLAAERITVSVWAMATAEGGRIPTPDGLLSHEGVPVQPRLDEPTLRALAQAGGGDYVAYSREEADIERLLTTLGTAPWAGREHDAAAPAQSWQDRGPWLVLLVLPLAALAFRRGWLGMLLLACGLHAPPEVHAWGWDDLWWRTDQQAWRALAAGDEKQALALSADPLLLGAVHYRAGRYEAALAAYSRLDSAPAHYNRGNALARLGRLEEALAAYEQALQRAPDHGAARHNRERVHAALAPVAMPTPLPPPAERPAAPVTPPPAVAPYVEERLEPPSWLRKPDAQAPPEPGPDDSPGGLGGGLVLLEDQGRPKNQEESGAVGQAGDQRPSRREETGTGPTRAGRHTGEQPPSPQGQERGPSAESSAGQPPEPSGGERAGERPGEDGASAEQAGVASAPPAGEEPGGEPLPTERNGDGAEGMGRAGPGMPEPAELETRQALEQWLARIPDRPGGLLREKFLREHRNARDRVEGLPPW